MKHKQLFTFILLFASGAFAGPSGINLSGKISVQPSGSSLISADVDFRIRVLSPNGCVLYTERFDNLDLSSTSGAFNLTIGNGAATYNAWDATPATRNSKASLLKLFSNSSPAIASGLTPYGAGPCAAGAYTPSADDGRQVVIELDPTGAGTPGSFLTLSPYHQIRAVPYAMLADMASDSEKLGGVAAAQYAKITDLTAAVPANETDPTVQAFAKTAVPDCAGTGKVLTANAAGVLSCVAGGAGSYTLPAATASVLGGVIVGSGLSVAVDGTVSVSNTLTTDITNLQTAVGNKVDKASMAVCATNQVLVWQSPGDNFLCSNILITASQVSDFSTAVDARITAGGAKLPLAGGTMTGSITMSGAGLVINMGNNNLANVSYLHLENKTTDPVFSAGNNGYVWYNSTDKAIKFNDGTAIRSLAVGGAGGAPTGAAGGDLAGTYPNPTLKATGTAGTYVKVTTDAEGRVVSGTVLAATDIPSLDAAKIITGQFGDARISDVAVDKITSGASKYFTYAPNNVACNLGEVLKKTANGWECGADAGSGGADASSIRGVTVDAAAPTIGKFMQHDGTKWTFVSMPVCTANKVLTFNASGIASCADIAGLVDANIASGAAIARSKIAAGTANHVAINDGSGNFSSEAQLATSRGGTGQSTYTNGQLLIGKTDGTLAKATLTAGTGVTVTNGDGTITIASTGSAAPTGAAGGDLTGTYPNPTLVAAGTAGTYTKVTTDAQGRVTVGASLAATDIPVLDAAKITTGQFADAQLAGISVDKVTSGASKYFTYAPNNVACNTGEVLKKTTNGWECGTDAGAGGADASSIRGVAVDGVATASQGNYMQYDGVKWTFVSMPVCTANKVITFSAAGIATCTDIGGLVDSQISSSAAIARTKLANGTANHVLINNGSGVMSSEAQLAVSRGGTGQSTYTDGQILIGKTDGTLAKSTITAGTGVTVTNADGTITIAATGGGAPTGTAGGDLAGTYPNPTLKATGTAGTYTKVTTDAEGRVTTGAALAATDIPALDAAKITTGQFADAMISDLGVDKITSGALKYFTYKPNNVACAAGEFLAWNNSRWECTPAPTGGGPDTLAGLSCASGNVPSWDGAAWVCQTTGNTNVASSIVKRSPSGAIAAGIADFTGVRLFDSVSGYITLQTPATVTSYSLTLPTSAGTTGQMLTTNGSGVLSWTSPSASLPGLASTNIWVGNGSGVATSVTMSGDATISNTGALTVANTSITAAKIANTTITNSQISSSAAIARSKLGTGTANALVINDSSGNFSNLTCSTNGHVPSWNGTTFACAAPAASLPALTAANIWVGNASTVATAVAPSGDVTMTNAGAFSVTKLQGRSVSSTTPTANQVLMYISSTWTPTSPTTAGAVSSLLMLDSSGIANSYGVGVKGSSTGTVTIQAPTTFSNYSLTLPSSAGSADQVLTTNGSGTLAWQNQGGAPTIVAKTADFTVGTAENNYFYLVSNTTNATLPAVASVPAGFRVTFKRMGGSNVNVNASGGETIDGATQRSLQSAYQAISMINTGSEWVIISGGAVSTSAACVPGSQSYSSSGTFSYAIDAAKATNCTFTITVQGAGGATAVSPAAPGGRGGAVRFTYTAAAAGTFEMLIGGPGTTGGGGGYGGGGNGGNASTNKGAGGGGASAIRFTTTTPTDTLLAIAGGGGGAGAVTYSNAGGDGGASGGGSNGSTSGAIDYGRGGVNNVGGIAGTGTTQPGGAGGSSGGNGSTGGSGSPGTGGAGFSAFSVSGGGGGAGATTSGSGGGGGGYGGGGGGSISTNYGGGGGGGGYISPSATSFTNLTGPSSGSAGSILIEWN
jgi:hypothetical protein